MSGPESCHVPSITEGNGPAYKARSHVVRRRCSLHETCAGRALLSLVVDVILYFNDYFDVRMKDSGEIASLGQSRSLIG
jgi:hypothetical protein